jgi:ectoine hydroxylase-related dioxygenase (phytanoyl-CoA dioxygenase family)
MSAMDREDEFFAELKRHPRFIALAAELFGAAEADIVAENMQFFGKAAREGSAAPWHQDNGFQNYTPPEACMFWLALDDVTEENGCVRFATGSHKLGLQPHRPSGVLGFSMGAVAPVPARFPEFPCAMPRGSLSVHHCNTFHCSGPNHSDHPRRSIAINLRTARAVMDMEARARVKEEAAKLLAKEMRP